MRFKKEYLTFLIAIAIIAFFMATVIHYSFYQTCPFTNEELISELDAEVNSMPPNKFSAQEREGLLLRIDDFVLNNYGFKQLLFLGPCFVFPTVHNFFKLRFERVLDEIERCEVENQIILWYLYNAGVIAKSSNLTIGFDLAGSYYFPFLEKLADYVDILIISHPHGDHLDPKVIRGVIKKGGIVIAPSGKIEEYGGIEMVKYITSKAGIPQSPQLVLLSPGESKEIKRIKISAYRCPHIGMHRVPNNCFLVEDLDGISILHTGDADHHMLEEKWIADWKESVDIFLPTVTMMGTPRASKEFLEKLKPKITIPVHMLELGHNIQKHELTYQTVFREIENFKDLTKYMPMVWGENYTVPAKSKK